MDLSVLSITFGVAAGVIQLVGYIVYLRLSNGHANTSSWLIWTLSAGVDLVSYDYVTDRDLVKEILPAVCAVACVVTFGYLLIKRRFGMPDRTDWGMVAADTVISVAWWQEVVGGITANLMLQASTIVSAAPMIRGMLKGKEQENPTPWAIWTLAYLCHCVSVLANLDHWSELAYPIANVIMHGAILLTALYFLRRPVS